jgi:hypothetical protein
LAIPKFHNFDGESGKNVVEHVNAYLSQLGSASKEDCMRVRNFPLSLTGIAFA